MKEHETAIVLAKIVLDDPRRDPDDTLSIISRQLLRTREQLDAVWHFAACPHDHCERCVKDAAMIKGLHEKLGPPT